MRDLGMLRAISRFRAHLTVRIGEEANRPTDGKIKAARCGAVGRQKSEGRSATWREASIRSAACHFTQLLGKARLRAPRLHPHHDS